MRPALLAFLALGVTGRAAAQRPTPADSARRDSAAAIALNPITVRASGVAPSLLDLPLAVTRVSAEARLGAQGLGLDGALAEVPGVIAQSRAGGTDIRLSIRGFGSRGAGDRSNSGTSRGVRVLLDGVPETEPDGRTSFDQVDLATVAGIEVIRSNASSLWGNAAGGVVSLTTLDPAAPARLAVETSAGGFGLMRYALLAGAPLGAGGGIAASLVRSTMDGWRAHADGARTLASVSVRSPVSARTELGVYAIATDNFFRIPGPLTRAQADSAPTQPNATYLARDERRHNRLGRLAVTLQHLVGRGGSVGGMAFVAPKFLQRSERGTFRDFTRYHVGGNVVGRTALRLGRWSGVLTAGVDEAYQDGAILFYGLTPQNTRDTVLRDDKREGANNLGGFVQQELAAGRWSLMIGARYDAIRYYAESFIEPRLDAARTFSRVTPKLGIVAHLAPRHSVYATLGGGVEAPAGNETDPASTFGQDTVTAINPLLEPIRSTSLELGAKGVAVRGGATLFYDVAAYRTVVRNEIVPYRGGRFYFTAGEARRSGLEVGTSLHSAAGLRLGANLTWSHHRYASYLVDSVHYGRPGAFANYSGNRVVGVPDGAYTVSAGYAPGRGGPVLMRVVVQGMSRWFADDANTVIVPAFHVVNLVVGTERPVAIGGGFAVRGALSLNNAFAARYIGSAFLNPDVVAGEPVAFEPGLPRHIVVTLGIERVRY